MSLTQTPNDHNWQKSKCKFPSPTKRGTGRRGSLTRRHEAAKHGAASPCAFVASCAMRGGNSPLALCDFRKPHAVLEQTVLEFADARPAEFARCHAAKRAHGRSRPGRLSFGRASRPDAGGTKRKVRDGDAPPGCSSHHGRPRPCGSPNSSAASRPKRNSAPASSPSVPSPVQSMNADALRLVRRRRRLHDGEAPPPAPSLAHEREEQLVVARVEALRVDKYRLHSGAGVTRT